MVQSLIAEKPRRKTRSKTIQSREPGAPQTESIHGQPVSTPDDIQIRISKRAYELYAERGYREGCALDDWLEAERDILGIEHKV